MTKNEALTVLGQVCQVSKLTWAEHQSAQQALTTLSLLVEPDVKEAVEVVNKVKKNKE